MPERPESDLAGGQHSPNERTKTSDEMRCVTVGQLEAMLVRQRYKCPLSGRTLTPETAAIDHVVPLSRGGPHVVSNMQIVDATVNDAKGSLTQYEFVALCLEVAEEARKRNSGEIEHTPERVK